MSGSFAGWRMVWIGFTTQAIAITFTIGTFGLFLEPMERAFEASRAEVSLGLALMNLMMNLVMPWLGRAMDRGSIRTIMTLGALLNVAALWIIAAATELWLVLAAFGLVASFGTGMLGPLASSTVVANWFDASRGRALGLVNCGAPAGIALLAPVVAWAIDAIGWRGTFVAYGAITLLIAAPLAWFGLVDRPQSMGQLPDGATAPKGAAVPAGSERVWTSSALLRSRDFWGTSLSFGIPVAASIVMTVHLVAFALDLGVARQSASLLLSVQSGAGIAGTLLFGALADRLPLRPLMWVSIGLQIATTCVLLTEPSYALMLATIAVLGVCFGGLMPLVGSMIGTHFGAPAFGQVMGLAFLILMPLAFVGPPLAGAIHDATGSYARVFQLLIASYAVAAAAVLLQRGARE